MKIFLIFREILAEHFTKQTHVSLFNSSYRASYPCGFSLSSNRETTEREAMRKAYPRRRSSNSTTRSISAWGAGLPSRFQTGGRLAGQNISRPVTTRDAVLFGQPQQRVSRGL